MRQAKLPEFTALTNERPEHSGLAALARRVQGADVAFSENYLAKTPFHSTFWALRRLKNSIAANAHLAHGKMLDVGCGLKPYESVFAPHVDEHVGYDYSPTSGFRGNRADVCGDAAALPFESGSFDTVLCTEVLVDLPDPDRTISEFARVLKPGGTLITTAAFVFPVHDRNDYFRFSPDGLAVIMRRYGLTVDRIVPTTGTAVTIANLVNLYIYDHSFIWNKWLYPVGLVLRPLLWLFCFAVNLIGGLLELILPDETLPIHVLTAAHKPMGDVSDKDGFQGNV